MPGRITPRGNRIQIVMMAEMRSSSVTCQTGTGSLVQGSNHLCVLVLIGHPLRTGPRGSVFSWPILFPDKQMA